jgi:hypothetical protein
VLRFTSGTVAGGNEENGLVELDPEPQPKLVRTTVNNPNAAIPRSANFTDQHLFVVLIPSGIFESYIEQKLWSMRCRILWWAVSEKLIGPMESAEATAA